MYYRGADAALVVYDITDESSYNLAKRHIKELKENSEVKVIAFIGNKCDRKDRVVNETDAKLYAHSQKLLYMETSAKLNINIINILNILGDELPRVEKLPPAAPDMQFFSDLSPPKPGCCG